jgi:hypothetical protein
MILLGIDGELAAADLPSYHGCIFDFMRAIWALGQEFWRENAMKPLMVWMLCCIMILIRANNLELLSWIFGIPQHPNQPAQRHMEPMDPLPNHPKESCLGCIKWIGMVEKQWFGCYVALCLATASSQYYFYCFRCLCIVLCITIIIIIIIINIDNL